MLGHIRIALRTLGREPALAVSRILTIAIVVTAIGAVLAVANVVFFRPLPFPNEARVVRAYLQPPGTTGFENNSTPHMSLTYMRLRDRLSSFERFEGFWVGERAIAGDGEPESVQGARTSAGFFATLGGRPIEGRVFTEQEVADDARVVVLGHGLWQRRFGAVAATGRTLLIDNEPHTVVGVLQPEFEPAFTGSQFWTPMNLRASERQVTTFVQVVAVLKPGVSATAAEQEINTLFPAIVSEWPDVLTGFRGGVIGWHAAQYGPQQPAILMLIAAVVGLSLLAAANLANLTLADVISRRGDFAVRAALGASKWSIAAPEMLQAVLIAVVGGALGLIGAAALVPALISLDQSNLLNAHHGWIDWRVLSTTLAAAIALMMIAVGGPMLRFASPQLASVLASSGRRAVGDSSSARTRTALVVAQTAISLVLLSSAALIASTLLRTATVDPGFGVTNVVTAQLRLSARGYPDEAGRTRFVAAVLERVRAIPGVVSAGTTLNQFATNQSFLTMVQIEDAPTPDGRPQPLQFRRISPGYLETMQVPILSGRDFTDHDRSGSQPVAIISRSLAERVWAKQDPVGRRIRRGTGATPWLTIVGVVGDVRDVGLDTSPADTIYTPFFQGNSTAVPIGLVVRTHSDPVGTIQSIRQAVLETDPNQPLSNVVTLERFLTRSLGAQRFRATLIGICGVIGLLLAAVGTYGVTARAIVERRREAGLRLALGGDHRSVWWLIVTTSLRSTMVGAAIGVILSAFARSGLGTLLPELRGASATVFSIAAAAVIIVVGVGAAMFAARALRSMDPIAALRLD